MVRRTLYVEGGGDNNKALRTDARRAFSTLLAQANLAGRMPRVVASGSRSQAYKDFCRALAGASGADRVFLLVDAEGRADGKPSEQVAWNHVATREGDGWSQPESRHEDHLHLMVQAMEAWMMADRAKMAAYFGADFDAKQLPKQGQDLESIPKSQLAPAIAEAAKKCKKRSYDKGKHSFGLLETLNVAAIRQASPWAERFFASLERLL